MLWRHKRWHLTVGVPSGSVNFLAIFGIKCFRHRVYTSASELKKKSWSSNDLFGCKMKSEMVRDEADEVSGKG